MVHSRAPKRPAHLAEPSTASHHHRFASRREKTILFSSVVALPLVLFAVLSAFFFGNPTFAESAALPSTQAVQDSAKTVRKRPVITEASASPAVSENSFATQPITEPTIVSLSAVGDNLIHIPVVNTADDAEGVRGDGLYDFSVLYEGMRDIVATHDINFIDIETPMGGDEKGIMGGDVRSVTNNPVFNTPADNAADIAAFGYNLATTASNHSWDQGFDGIERMAQTWSAYPSVTVAGTYVSAEDRANIRTFEKNGVSFAFLSYTSGLNDGGPEEDQLWSIPFLEDKETAAAEIQRAHELADCVIVSVSWGLEYDTSATDYQREYAQFFADQGVDLVLGFHPHVIGPVEWVDGKDASGEPTGHRTLIAYSLGDLIGHMPNPLSNVTGCFTCNIVKEIDGSIRIADPAWTPYIIHFSGGCGHSLYKLSDYSTELGRTHDVLGSLEDPVGYARDLTASVMDPNVVTVNW